MSVWWHLIFQQDELPISVVRFDGVREAPPAGLLRYVELAHGAWTLEPATKPLGVEGVEWPRPCVWGTVTGCRGAMTYVEHVTSAVMMAETGETLHPAGWQCKTCGAEDVNGFSVLTTDVPRP